MSVSLIDGHIDDDVMTDEQIIKALENIINEKIGCCAEDCAFYDGKVHSCAQTIAKHALDLINRKNAEIERLNSPVLMIDNVDLSENEIKEKLINLPVQIFPYNEEQIRNEAIKEFAERLKERGFADKYYEHEAIVYVADIDNLVKEMVGAESGN